MIYLRKIASFLSPSALLLASCSAAQNVDAAHANDAATGFLIEEHGRFDEGWAMAFAPGTPILVISQKAGSLVAYDTVSQKRTPITGAPAVDYGGQGGFGDVAFLASEAAQTLGTRTIYLSWAEAGPDGEGTRGAVVGKGTLNCTAACALEGLEVIWRQSPKTGRRGHYSHRILISPDEQFLYIASGDRQELTPAQDTANNLGTIVRLQLDGTPAPGNPLAAQPSPTNQIFSWGHRNILGMDWDQDGRLWEIEHGPAGGDELNLVEQGGNYGWPVRSNGDHYNGKDIPDHSKDDGFIKPKADWTPVIAPGDMLIYRGALFAQWSGHALVAGLSSKALILVELDGENAHEAGRYAMGARLRALAQGGDGSVWVMEDGTDGRLLQLLPD